MKSNSNLPYPKEILNDLQSRIEQFVRLNDIAIESSDPEIAERLRYQNNGFSSVLHLIEQIRKRGTIWRGGYVDNYGPIYTDYLQEMIDSHMEGIT